MSTIRKSKHFIIHMHPNGTIIRSFAQISIIPVHQTPQRTGQRDSERQKDTDKYKKTAIRITLTAVMVHPGLFCLHTLKNLFRNLEGCSMPCSVWEGDLIRNILPGLHILRADSTIFSFHILVEIYIHILSDLKRRSALCPIISFARPKRRNSPIPCGCL